jgi:hypothetical protein
MSKIDLVEEELWDHYSGLPNPLWYQYKRELEDEEDDFDNIISVDGIETEI